MNRATSKYGLDGLGGENIAAISLLWGAFAGILVSAIIGAVNFISQVVFDRPCCGHEKCVGDTEQCHMAGHVAGIVPYVVFGAIGPLACLRHYFGVLFLAYLQGENSWYSKLQDHLRIAAAGAQIGLLVSCSVFLGLMTIVGIKWAAFFLLVQAVLSMACGFFYLVDYQPGVDLHRQSLAMRLFRPVVDVAILILSCFFLFLGANGEAGAAVLLAGVTLVFLALEAYADFMPASAQLYRATVAAIR